MITKPPLGPLAWLPPRGWLMPDGTIIPCGGPHYFNLFDGSLDGLRELHRMVERGES